MLSEQIVLFDMDGTLCDYEGQLIRDLQELANPSDPIIQDLHNCPEWIDKRIDLIRKVPGWWRNLQRLELGFDVLEICKLIGFEIRILTKGPRRTKNAWTEKVEWIHEHVVPDIPNTLMTITEDKGLVYGKVLVDDFGPYMDRWLRWRPRGLGIMPAQKWNQNYSHPNVIRYDGKNKQQIREALLKSYRRPPREK